MKLIFSVLDRADIWPQFRRYYQSQGVTEFLCVSYGPQLDGVAHTFKSPIEHHQFTGRADADCHNEVINRMVRPDEWCIVADLDEFYSVPGMSLIDTIHLAQREKCNHIRGIFYDRITADGHLPAKLEPNLWKQFPWSVNASEVISGGCIHKICAMRGDMRVAQGHHAVITNPRRPLNRLAKVYHFKWWAPDPTNWFGDRPMTDKLYKSEMTRLDAHLKQHSGYLDTSVLSTLE